MGDRTSLRRTFGIRGFVVVFVGRHERTKGYLDLLRAIKIVRDHGIEAHLLAIGNTPDSDSEELRATIKELDLATHVTDLGPRTDRIAYLAAADVIALPSYREGFPLALLEGMAAGLPVVATTIGGIPELVEDGQQGFLVHPGDVKALAEVLQRLAGSPEERSALGRSALERAKAFDLSTMAREYIRLFHRVTG